MRITRRRGLGLALLGALVVGLLAPPSLDALRPGAAAPEIAGAQWINSAPLTMAGLRGRVVLVEFWTYG